MTPSLCLLDHSRLSHMVVGVHMGRLALGGPDCRSAAYCCYRVGGRKLGSHEELVVGHLVGDLAYVEEEPTPVGDQWGLGGGEGRVQEEVGPVGGVGDLGEGHNLEEVGQGEEVPEVAGQTDQGKERGEVAYHPDLEGLLEEGEGPDQEVVVQEGQGGQVDQEEVGEGLASLCYASSRSCPPAGRD